MSLVDILFRIKARFSFISGVGFSIETSTLPIVSSMPSMAQRPRELDLQFVVREAGGDVFLRPAAE